MNRYSPTNPEFYCSGANTLSLEPPGITLQEPANHIRAVSGDGPIVLVFIKV